MSTKKTSFRGQAGFGKITLYRGKPNSTGMPTEKSEQNGITYLSKNIYGYAF